MSAERRPLRVRAYLRPITGDLTDVVVEDAETGEVVGVLPAFAVERRHVYRGEARGVVELAASGLVIEEEVPTR